MYLYVCECVSAFVSACIVCKCTHMYTHKTQKHKQNSIECPGESRTEKGCQSWPSIITPHHECYIGGWCIWHKVYCNVPSAVKLKTRIFFCKSLHRYGSFSYHQTGGAWFKSWLDHQLVWLRLSWFPSVITGKYILSILQSLTSSNNQLKKWLYQL